MAGDDETSKSGRVGAWLALILGSLAIFARVAVGAHSVAAGLLAVVGFGVFVFGLIVWSRRRAERQIEETITSGEVSVEMGLDFSCLPGDWPARARETLNPAGAGRTPSLPVRLSSAEGKLMIDKRRGFWLGRSPFCAEMATADITGVSVGSSRTGIVGSSIVISLRTGEQLRGDLPVNRERAEVLASRIRALSGGWATATDAPSAIRVTSPPPPDRTSSGRAGLLMVATLAPWLPAMIGAQDGAWAAVSTTLALFYALWLMLRRPPQMAVRLAAVLGIAAVGFAVDATVTGQPIRLGGSVIAAAIAWWMVRSNRRQGHAYEPAKPLGRAGKQASALAVVLALGAVGASLWFAHDHEVRRAIPGAPGYVRYGGPHGKLLAVGRPWGRRCQPVRFTVEQTVPDWVYAEAVAVVNEARADGIDVTIETRSFTWDPSSLYYPPGQTPADVMRVPIFADDRSAQRPLEFGWDAVIDSDGSHERVTDLQVVLHLPALTNKPADVRHAIRRLVAFAAGIRMSTKPQGETAIAHDVGLDRFTPDDVAAIQLMSGCGEYKE